jgi:N-acetylglucosaminyl-diphospho-decaprenol L-rhamnosyltransferase
VSDELFVVTVTYSPGAHLGRFLATLSHATERPVTVIMADNGSTDGSPEEAVERFPNTRLLRTGGNLGYGSAVNRAVTELRKDSCDLDLFIVANPDVQWGPGSIDALLEAAERWPTAASLGPLIRDPDGSVYPSARHQPSIVRGGMHAVIGPLWRSNPWTAAYRQDRLEPSERQVGWLSGSCLLLRGARGRDGRTYTSRLLRFCTTRAIPPAVTRPATWPPTITAPTLFCLIGTTGGGRLR